MRFSRKIAPEIKPRQNFITKKRLREDEIDFDKLRSYRLDRVRNCLLYTSPSPRDLSTSRMPSSA